MTGSAIVRAMNDGRAVGESRVREPTAGKAPHPSLPSVDAAADSAAVLRRARRRQAIQRRQNNALQSAGTVRLIEVPAPARAARLRWRHWSLLGSLVVMVVLPVTLAAWYLWARAADQYASTVGFTVRTEEAGPAFAFLGGLSDLSSTSSSDTDILYKFIQSQELVSQLDRQLDLRRRYSGAPDDPIFSLPAEAGIETLARHWARMVHVEYDASAGLIEVEARAFSPGDAQLIAQAIFAASNRMINRLSDIARVDTTRHARQDLDDATARLKNAREAVTAFRNRTQIVDPGIDIQGQMGLLNSLQAQQAESLIAFDLLRGSTRPNDPRITQAERKIAVIDARIEEERRKIGANADQQGSEGGYADLVGTYERLSVDREFAETAYLAARASYDGAVAEARRQSRYLAAYMNPTLPEDPLYPRRASILAIFAALAFGLWSVLSLVAYSLRDRR